MPRFPHFLYPQEARFPIHVKTLTGKIHDLQVTSSNTILDVKKMIEEKDGMRVDVQRLIYAAKQYDNGEILDPSQVGIR